MSFLKLNPGSNYVRIVTQPYQYRAHSKYVVKGEPHYGQKLKCAAMPDPTLMLCKPCNDGERFHARWILGVISRKDSAFHYLDIGFEIFGQISSLVRTPLWGEPKDYDVDFLINDYDKVQIIPQEKINLNAAEVILVDHIDLEEMKRLTEFATSQPPYIEKI